VSAENGHACAGDAAAYVLGALEPPEAEAFRRHIADCAACRDEVAAYEQVTQDLPAAGGERYELPKDLRKRVMREVRATPKPTAATSPAVRAPRSWRPLVAWGGALAAVIVVAIVAVALGTGGSSTRTIEASAGNAELRISGGHADLIVHRLPQLPAGRTYQMWVTRGNGPPAPTGTLFGVSANGTAAVGVPGSVDGVSAVMVTQEPAGGTPAPTSAPVIVARVS
jgi:anti-sigma-K factor RskA